MTAEAAAPTRRLAKPYAADRAADREHAGVRAGSALGAGAGGGAGRAVRRGSGLARGYLNRPGLTAERFVPDPFRREPGARMYRTGDLARWRPDGSARVPGPGRPPGEDPRASAIELGEIEAALREHPAVARGGGGRAGGRPGGKRLVAYVVPAPGPVPDPAELRGAPGGAAAGVHGAGGLRGAGARCR